MSTRFCFIFSCIILASITGELISASSDPNKDGKHQGQIARSNIGLAGTSTTLTTNNACYSVSQSMGQMSVIGTFDKKGCFLLQGYQQAKGLANVPIPQNYLKAVVYPNPFWNCLNISFDILVVDKIQVTVFDMKGNAVYSETFPPTQYLNVPLEGFSNGTYFLKINIDKYLFVSPIIKQQR